MNRRSVLWMTLVYLFLSAAITWPLVLHLPSLVPNDLGDSLLNMWLMAWNARVMPLTSAWWNAPQFYPLVGVMAFSEHLLGLAVVTTPVMLLTSNVVLAYNIAFFLSFPLCALAASWLTYSIVRRYDAAFLSGLAFGFAPYRLAQLSHVQVLSSYWMPLVFVGLHEYFRTRKYRWLVLFAGAWTLQALACGYYLFYLSILVLLWIVWFAARGETWRMLPRVFVAWLSGALLLSPVLYGYWTFQRMYGFRRGPREIEAFSADVASLLKASSTLRLWGWLNVVDRPESALFPGLTIVLLIGVALAVGWRLAVRESVGRLRTARLLVGAAAIFAVIAVSPLYYGPWTLDIGGVRLLSVANARKPFSVCILLLVVAGALHPSVRAAWRRRSAIAFYTAAAGIMWLFSLGPAPTLMNKPILYKAPYAWLMNVPGVEGVRVPARFWMLATLCLAAAAGLALRQLSTRWPRAARALVIVASAGVLADAWPTRLALWTPPDARPSHTAAIARLDLPLNAEHDRTALYRAIEHRVPLINGYSGYFAPHYSALQVLLAGREPAVLNRLSAFGPLEVTIDHDMDPDGALRQFVGSHPQATRLYSDAQYSAYRIEPASGTRTTYAAVKLLTVLPIASITATANPQRVPEMTDGNLITGWDAGRPQQAGDSVTIDLGLVRPLDSIDLLIGGYVADFPRRLAIDTSLDRTSWTRAWDGETALIAFSAALEDPHRGILPFPLNGVTARYVRLTETANDTICSWTIAELQILGR